MGRTIKIKLNDKQRQELENGYRNSENHIFRVRCQMVLLKAENRKSSEIGQILDFCEQAVNGWLWRYLETGIDGLLTKPGQGRIPILSVKQDAQAVRLSIQEHRQRISEAQAELEETLGRKFSSKTLRRFLKNCVLDINESENVPANRKPKRSTGIK
jgi:transposase